MAAAANDVFLARSHTAAVKPLEGDRDVDPAPKPAEPRLL